jgi:hypothetical protein
MTEMSASALPRTATRLPPSCGPAPLPVRFSPRWLIARLRAMSPQELTARLWHAAAAPVRALRARAVPAATPPLATVWLTWPATLDAHEHAALRAEAEAAIAGRYTLLGRGGIEAGPMPRWRQPFGTAPQVPPNALELDPAEEPRYALEINRHGHVAMLAQAALLLGSERYALRALEQIADWIRVHPVARGVGWSAAIEPALRLIQWSIAWQALAIASADQPAVRSSFAAVAPAWRRAVATHETFVATNLSSHSSANNHLLAELAGLAVAARTWRSSADADALTARFADEFCRQHSDDGVNREQATGYQLFVLDLGLHVRCAAAATGAAAILSEAFMQHLQRSAQFLRAVRDAGGHLPAWGDSDEADAVHLRPAPRDRVDALLAGVGDEAAGAVPASGAARPRAFAQGGYYLLGQDFGGAREVRAAIDCGPLGYLGIAAHGHADMLSLVLSVGGIPVLIDPGTFVYNARPAWRRRLRGTLMHNTVTVDGADQSEPAGPFLWLRKARARCESFHSSDRAGEFTGWHDGYGALPSAAVHRRRVTWDAGEQRLRVIDQIEGSGRHHVVVAWHLAPQLDCMERAGSLLIDLPRVRVRLAAAHLGSTASDRRGREDERFAWVVTRGDSTALLGWSSPRFGAITPATSLFFAGTAAGPITLQTDIELDWKAVSP